MTYVALILLASCIVLGFFLYVALVGHAEQIRDLLEEREELLTEIRRLRMGNHPAGRARHGNEAVDAPAVLRVRALLQAVPDADVVALREALEERDAGHEGGAGA